MKITARQLNDVINLDMRIPDAVEKEVVDSCKIVLQKMLDSATFVCIVPDAIAKYIIKISKKWNNLPHMEWV